MVATQGLATYVGSEISDLSQIYRAGGTSDEYLVLRSIINDANHAMSRTPDPYVHLITSGDNVQGGGTANTGPASRQADQALSLAEAYKLTGNTQYLDHAKSFLL